MERFYKTLAQSEINIIPMSSPYGFASEAYFQKNLNEILNQTNTYTGSQKSKYIVSCTEFIVPFTFSIRSNVKSTCKLTIKILRH